MMLLGFVKLLRDYIPASAVGNMTVQEALAATADLDGLILCEKKPFAWVGMSGHGAIVSMTPPTVQPDLWKQCYIAAKDQWK